MACSQTPPWGSTIANCRLLHLLSLVLFPIVSLRRHGGTAVAPSNTVLQRAAPTATPGPVTSGPLVFLSGTYDPATELRNIAIASYIGVTSNPVSGTYIILNLPCPTDDSSVAAECRKLGFAPNGPEFYIGTGFSTPKDQSTTSITWFGGQETSLTSWTRITTGFYKPATFFGTETILVGWACTWNAAPSALCTTWSRSPTTVWSRSPITSTSTWVVEPAAATFTPLVVIGLPSQSDMAREALSPACTPHSVIITSLWKYNLISVATSIVLNLLGYFFARRRRPLEPWRIAVSVLGQISLAILKAFLTGLVVEKSCPSRYHCPSAVGGFFIWATMPRATAAVFIVNFPFALWHESRKRLWASPGGPQSTNAPYILNPAMKGAHVSGVYHYQEGQTATAITPPSDAVAHNSERENLFLKTCTATFITEFFLCFIGVSVYFLPATANASLYQPDPMVNRFTCLFHVDSMYAEKNTHTYQTHAAACSPQANNTMRIAAVGMLAGFCLFALLFVIFISCGCRRGNREEGYCLPAWIGPWAALTVATVFTWIMWVTFLTDTSDADYCVGNMGMVDVVNIVLIVVLNIWRQVI